MDIQALGSLAVVGVLVSGAVQFLKAKFGGGAKTLAILAVLSLVAGVVGLVVKDHPNFLVMVGTVLVVGNAFYSFVLQFVESKN